MVSIQTRTRVSADGTLDLHIPTSLREGEVEVILVVQPMPQSLTRANGPASSPEDLGWPPGFFEEVAGGWQGEPLERAPQGAYEQRDELV